MRIHNYLFLVLLLLSAAACNYQPATINTGTAGEAPAASSGDNYVPATVAAADSTVVIVDAATFENLKMKVHLNMPVVDVRRPEEYKIGHLYQAVNVPIEADSASFASGIAGFDRHRPIGIYCDAENRRTRLAAAQLRSQGFTRIYCLKDGVSGWGAAEKTLFEN